MTKSYFNQFFFFQDNWTDYGQYLQTAFIPFPQNYLQLFISVRTSPFNNLLKLVAVSESSIVNKSDTTFSPTTLLLIFEGEI
jgi:hypothetical protein